MIKITVKYGQQNCVLIVAKCIVNESRLQHCIDNVSVLIVAKCIVNITFLYAFLALSSVLIVAKCIVNKR